MRTSAKFTSTPELDSGFHFSVSTDEHIRADMSSAHLIGKVNRRAASVSHDNPGRRGKPRADIFAHDCVERTGMINHGLGS